MAQSDRSEQPWERPETVAENEFFTITDERAISSFLIVSHNGGFSFTLLYEEWSEFVEAVRLLQTQGQVETQICDAAQEQIAGETQWHFAVHYPEHELVFYLVEAEWQGLQAAVEAAADYPWSPTLYRVDVAQMRDKVTEQRRWLTKRQRKAGDRS